MGGSVIHRYITSQLHKVYGLLPIWGFPLMFSSHVRSPIQSLGIRERVQKIGPAHTVKNIPGSQRPVPHQCRNLISLQACACQQNCLLGCDTWASQEAVGEGGALCHSCLGKKEALWCSNKKKNREGSCGSQSSTYFCSPVSQNQLTAC